jgi:ectoine hydroxylase-related dioxygenase (phytanoyl-CoA dioxygenase family)
MSFQLSDQQLNQFLDDGYLVVSQLFDQEEAGNLLWLAKSDTELLKESYAKRDATGGQSRLAVRNDLDDSPYAAIVRSQRIVNTMQALLADEVYHYHHKMMLKEPKVGGAWDWHQDYGYWYENGCLFPDMASCLIAVDRAVRANGCLQVIRGSHKLGRLNHSKTGEQKGAEAARVDAALERLDLVYCELEPGDAIFFHGNLLHRSDQNTSDESRWSLICCYNTRHNDPFIKEGRHPNYSPLEVWDDQRVREVLTGVDRQQPS